MRNRGVKLFSVIPVSMLPLDDSVDSLGDMNQKLSEIIQEQSRQSEALAKSMVDIKIGIEVHFEDFRLNIFNEVSFLVF